MAVLLFAVELEVLTELNAPDRGEFLKEAAAAYRARGLCLRAKGRAALAQIDEKRAVELEDKAKTLTNKGNPSDRSPADTTTVQAAGRSGQSGDNPATATPKRPEEVAGDGPNAASGEIQLVNNWTGAVTVVIDGTSYRLPAGQQRTISRAAGTFAYEVAEARHRATGTVEAGKVFRIRVGNRDE